MTRERRIEVAAGMALMVLVAAVYGQTAGHGFVSLDDTIYIVGNPMVRAGLSIPGAVWALATFHAGNWHPLAWLSHMLDVSLFGLNAGAHHLTSAFLHAANSFLLFILLFRTTGAAGRSLFAAALFALHPTRVESVAWAAERKDVLCGFFFLLGANAYARYASRGGKRDFLAVALCHLFALMSKPMAVTFPFALLLLDAWPLNRRIDVSRFVEKIPLFALTAASCAMTFAAQSGAGFVGSRTLTDRLGNAAIAVAAYLRNAVWPTRLAPFYPHAADGPGGLDPTAVAFSVALLAGLGVIAIAVRKKATYAAVGYAWFLGTLVPTLGFVQVGLQGMADRYVYLPYVGLFVAISWGAHSLLPGRETRAGSTLRAAVTASIVAGLTLLSVRQTAMWKDEIELFQHAVDVSGPSAFAYDILGVALYQRGRYEEAVEKGREAVRLMPGYGFARSNLGSALYSAGNVEGAIVQYREATRLAPSYEPGWYNLGTAQLRANRPSDAIPALREATRLDPVHVDARLALGVAYMEVDRRDEAEAAFREALRLDPGNALAHANLSRLRR